VIDPAAFTAGQPRVSINRFETRMYFVPGALRRSA
jgi:hypothetical protein